MFAWRTLSNANLLLALEWLAQRRENGAARQTKAPASQPPPRPASPPAR